MNSEQWQPTEGGRVKVTGTPPGNSKRVRVKDELLGKVGTVLHWSVIHTPILLTVNIDGGEYAFYADEVTPVATES